ncbi:MAG: GNAT family N-acetyltransferase [Oscillospiraceae bacterium]|jgi:predicted GNAT family N-acyltransferase|nr:GNAT family N-acetyltransferase [Oscillospiraceae bacterium]
MVTGRWVRPGEDIAPALAVRRAVFVDEQGFAAENEVDAFDPLSWHMVLWETERPVATGRIYWHAGDFHIGRVCVLHDRRGTGLGDLLMRLLLCKALDHSARNVVLAAQVQAMGFYAKYGFAPEGPRYEEEGGLHQTMRTKAGDIRLDHPCQNATPSSNLA